MICGGCVRKGKRLALQGSQEMLHRGDIFCTLNYKEEFARKTEKGSSDREQHVGEEPRGVCVCGGQRGVGERIGRRQG